MHLLREIENLVVGLFVEPMVHRAVELVATVGRDLLGELALEAREHVIELEGVGRKMHPLGRCSEDGKGVAGPQAVGLAPVGDFRYKLLGILVEAIEVALPLEGALAGLNILKDDAAPLGVGNTIADLLNGISRAQVLNLKLVHLLNVVGEFLVCFVVPVVQRAAVEANNACEAVSVIDCSGSGNLGAETVATNRRHGDLVLIHEPYHIVGHILPNKTAQMVPRERKSRGGLSHQSCGS